MSVAPHLTPAEDAAVAAFVAQTRALLGRDLYEIRLFGSRARGEGDEDSDVDLAVIVSDAGRSRRRQVYDLAYDASQAHSVLLAPLVIERDRLEALRRAERLLAREIDTEGTPL